MVASPPILEVPKACKTHSANNKSKVNNEEFVNERTESHKSLDEINSQQIMANYLLPAINHNTVKFQKKPALSIALNTAKQSEASSHKTKLPFLQL